MATLEDVLATVELYEKLCEQYYEADADVFIPQKQICQVKREGPATKHQKENLSRIIQYHGITTDYNIEELSRNEASRYMDQIILRYGRMPKEQRTID